MLAQFLFVFLPYKFHNYGKWLWVGSILLGFDYVVFLVQVHNVKGDYHDLKNGTCVRYLFLFSSHKVHNYNHSSLRFNDEYSFYVLENGVLHRCLFWFSCHKMHNDKEGFIFLKLELNWFHAWESSWYKQRLLIRFCKAESRSNTNKQRASDWAESRSYLGRE